MESRMPGNWPVRFGGRERRLPSGMRSSRPNLEYITASDESLKTAHLVRTHRVCRSGSCFPFAERLDGVRVALRGDLGAIDATHRGAQ
jgi:hypothetical protein